MHLLFLEEINVFEVFCQKTHTFLTLQLSVFKNTVRTVCIDKFISWVLTILKSNLAIFFQV